MSLEYTLHDNFNENLFHWWYGICIKFLKLTFHAAVSILTAIFPGGAGLAGTRMSRFWISLELRVMEVSVISVMVFQFLFLFQLVILHKICISA